MDDNNKKAMEMYKKYVKSGGMQSTLLAVDRPNIFDGKVYDMQYLNDVFEGDFNEAVNQAEKLIGNTIIKNKAAEIIVEMVFQLGMSGVSKFKKMRTALENQDYAEASAQMLDSKWAKQTKNRAEHLAEIMQSLA